MDVRVPKYMYIYDVIRNDIILQNVAEGDFLPTEKQLMDAFDAGRSTVRHALGKLQEDGYIAVRQGSGSVVLGRKDVRRTNFVNPGFDRVEIEYHSDDPVELAITSGATDKAPAPAEAAKALEIAPGTEVYRVQRVWSLNGNKYSHMVQYLRKDIMPSVRRYIDETTNIYTILQEHYGMSLKGGEEHITVCKADFIEANILDMEMGDPLICTSRTGVCEKGPFEYATFYQNPKYMGYKITLVEH